MPYPYSAVGGLLAQMEDTRKRLQGGLTPPSGVFQLPQESAPAPQADPSAPPSPSLPVASQPQPDLHQHRGGIAGGLMHLMGADKMTPELAALLTPDQQEQARPGLLRTLYNVVQHGKGPQTVMQERAANIMGLEKAKTARDQQIALTNLTREWMPRIMAARTPDERYEAQAGFASARAAIMGPESLGTVPNFLNSIKPDQVKPAAPEKPDTINTKSGVMIWDAEKRKYVPMLDDKGQPIMPWSQPLQPFPAQTTPYIGPNGRPMTFEPRARSWVEAPEGVTVPDKSKVDVKVINGERTLSYDDAANSIAALRDSNGKLKPPPSSFDRVATKSDWTNWMASDNGQNYMVNVRKLIRSWVVLIEGKRMSDADAAVNEAMRSFRPGEGAATVSGKMQTLESMARSIENLKSQGKITLPDPDAAPASGGTKEFRLPDGTVFRRP